MKGKSGIDWTLRSSFDDLVDVMCLAADIMEREEVRTGRTPPETWAAITGPDARNKKEFAEFLRRYREEIAPALYSPSEKTDKLPQQDLFFDDMAEGIGSFFGVLRSVCGDSPSPNQTMDRTAETEQAQTMSPEKAEG